MNQGQQSKSPWKWIILGLALLLVIAIVLFILFSQLNCGRGNQDESSSGPGNAAGSGTAADGAAYGAEGRPGETGQTDISAGSAAEPQPADTPLSVLAGQSVIFGRYEQDNNLQNGAEPVEWIVLDVQDGKALLVSRYGLESKPYGTEELKGITWEDSYLRAWLNSDFLSTAFNGEEQKAILPADVNNSDSLEYSMVVEGDVFSSEIHAVSGNNTRDYVFLLSCYETDRYFLTTGAAGCFPTEHAAANGAHVFTDDRPITFWWLRTAGEDNTAGNVTDHHFALDFYDARNNEVVRPALWVSLKSSAVKIKPDASASAETRLDAAHFRSVGNIVTFGKYEQDNREENGKEPIEWIVLDVRDGKALLLSRYALEGAAFNQYNTEEATWETCTLRTWLNSYFLNTAFSSAERSAILTTDVDNSKAQGSSDGADGGSNTQDKVFLLSYHEAYDLYFSNDEERICALTDYIVANNLTWIFDDHQVPGRHIGDWWLRSPGTYRDFTLYVLFDGTLDYSSIDLTCIAVRPALWISLESGIF